MIPALVYVLVIGHFLGDWVAQSDWMALNKSKRNWPLAVHVTVNMAVLFTAVAFWHDATRWHPATAYGTIWAFIAVNWLAHFATDYVTSRITTKLWFLQWTPAVTGWRELGHGVTHEETAYWLDDLGTRHWFFVVIGLDQLIHYVTLFATADRWLR